MAELIAATHPDMLARATAALERGGTVVLPTETVYGIAALPTQPGAVASIFDLKQRPPSMHLAVLVASIDQVELVVDTVPPGARALMERFWPGPLTLVLDGARPLVARLGAADGTVGVRCPDHQIARAIARRVGPIATTSANLHGQPTPDTATEIAEVLAGADIVIDAGPCVGGVASTVVDVTGDAPSTLRPGPVSVERIAETWAAALDS